MIVYKIDKQLNAQLNAQLRDMNETLGSMSQTLLDLYELVSQQRATISTPSINTFRDQLQLVIAEAIERTRTIAKDTQQLVRVSDQASKHLASIEEHFGAVLRDQTPEESRTVAAEVN